MNTIIPTIPVEIKKLGAINHAKINFNPLTVFVGENNTGKTYSAYLIGYTFSLHSLFDFLNEYHTGQTKVKFSEVDDLVEKIFQEKRGQIDLKSFITKNNKKYINCICDEIVPKKFQKFLASDSASFKTIKMKMDLKNTASVQIKNLLKYSKYHCDFLNDIWKESKFQVKINDGVISLSSEKNSDIELNKLKRIVFLSIFSIIHRSVFNEVYFFGAERTGLTLFVHSKSTQDQKTSDEEYSKKELDPKQPKTDEFPVVLAPHVEESLGTFVKCYDDDAYQERQEKIKKNPSLKKFLVFAELLENKILGGKIEIKEEKKKKIKKVTFCYHKNQKIQLNMPISSSAVKGLSPLALDLKYYIEPDELIIIDEPEMNLHPRAQAELIELIAMIVNAGVHVIITTHSPYIIDHLTNLMKAKNQPRKTKKLIDLFYLKQKDAFISVNDVSVYVFENGTANDILSEKGKIDWETFSRVSEELIDIYFKIDD